MTSMILFFKRGEFFLLQSNFFIFTPKGSIMEVTQKYIEFEGIKVPGGVHTPESMTWAWKEFEVRDDDVFNATYPKSGNYLLQENDWPF